MKKFNFIFDKSTKANNLKKIIFKKYKNYPIKNSKVIIVAGGDGFMLKTIKKFYKYNKPFYGINCGSVGFLLNKYVSKNIFSPSPRSGQPPVDEFPKCRIALRLSQPVPALILRPYASPS